MNFNYSRLIQHLRLTNSQRGPRIGNQKCLCKQNSQASPWQFPSAGNSSADTQAETTQAGPWGSTTSQLNPLQAPSRSSGQAAVSPGCVWKCELLPHKCQFPELLLLPASFNISSAAYIKSQLSSLHPLVLDHFLPSFIALKVWSRNSLWCQASRIAKEPWAASILPRDLERKSCSRDLS